MRSRRNERSPAKPSARGFVAPWPRTRPPRTRRPSTRTCRSRPSPRRGPRTRHDDARPARGAPGQAVVACQARGERPARGPASRARAGPVDPGPVRGDRRPRPSQGHPGAYHLWRTNLLPHEFVLLAIGRRRVRRRRVPRRDPGIARAVQPRAAPRRAGVALVRGAHPLPPARFRRRRRLRHAGDEARRARRGARARAATVCSTSPPSRRSSPRSSASSAGSDSTTNGTTAAGGGSSSRSRSATTSTRRRRLNREVGKVFRESQVYRIDHYLGKETVRNLLVFRFGNGIFEPLWNRRYVDHVQITVAESIGIENRGAFYEETGAVARRPPEPPAPAGQPRGHGAAGHVRGRRAARREGQGPPGDRHPPGRPGDRGRPRPVRSRLGRRDAGPGLPRRSRTSTRTRRPRRSSRRV